MTITYKGWEAVCIKNYLFVCLFVCLFSPSVYSQEAFGLDSFQKAELLKLLNKVDPILKNLKSSMDKLEENYKSSQMKLEASKIILNELEKSLETQEDLSKSLNLSLKTVEKEFEEYKKSEWFKIFIFSFVAVTAGASLGIITGFLMR